MISFSSGVGEIIVSTRDMTLQVRLEHWACVLQEQRTSGMSIKRFCKASGFSQNTYFYWQRKLREVACREILARPEGINEIQAHPVKEPASLDALPPPLEPNETALVPRGWAVCEVEAPCEAKVEKVRHEKLRKAQHGKARLDLETDRDDKALVIEIGKCRVRVPPCVDAELLSVVCRTLVSIC